MRTPARFLAALTLAFAVSATPAQASLKSMWGPSELPNGASAFPVYKALGVDVLQHQLSWRDVAKSRPADPRNPADPAYVWPASLDQAIAESNANGIRSLIMVKRTPDWANGGRGEQQVPNRLADYADFMAAASRHYASVRYWMVWGEPTRGDSFTPMPPNSPRGPRIYARMLDQAYVALKGVRRSNVVIGGNTWTVGTVSPPKFIRWMKLPNGKRPRLDWFGHNPFATRSPRLSRRPYDRNVRDISDVDTLHKELNRAYRKKKRKPRLWLSEFTVSAGRDNRAFSFHVTERQQAQWISGVCRIARKRYIAGWGWYTLLDEPTAPGSLTSGLLYPDARPKPAYGAFKRC